MIFEKHGFAAWVMDADGNTLPEYQAQEIGDDTIRCWIPSSDGQKFKIQWRVMEILHPKHDLNTVPILDGIRMSGKVSRKHKVVKGFTRQHFRQRTGASTARPYEFGRRTLSDNYGDRKLVPSLSDSLNTIKLVVDWGYGSPPVPRETFPAPQEVGPVHERAVKKGHDGAAQLGTEISVPPSTDGVVFTSSKEIKPITFTFCYASENWLRARDIIPCSRESDSQDRDGRTLKCERSATLDIIDIDDLETDDEVHIIKHVAPASATSSKKQRTLKGKSEKPKEEH
ncbi:unnamed protein product [Rhizoctonia solani]|uniref:DUF7918 domain-containing protein n=1 Tax=Rhizoctonia solani TaxID=456999 RepID=A0A8H3DMR5_9AGAM|nr:unnamed protein product [Rhizoctonia solani]